MKKRDVLVTTTYNDLGTIVDTRTKDLIRCKDCKRVETNACPMYRAHFWYTDEDYCSCAESRADAEYAAEFNDERKGYE